MIRTQQRWWQPMLVAIVGLMIVAGVGVVWFTRTPSQGNKIVPDSRRAIAWDAVQLPPSSTYFTPEQVRSYYGRVIEFESLAPEVRFQFYPHEALMSAFELEGDESKGRTHWLFQRRAYPRNTIPIETQFEALKALQAMPPALSAAQAWEFLGPAPVEQGGLSNVSTQVDPTQVLRGSVSGRVKAIAFDPTDPNIVYLATSLGGIWKSTNGGTSYTNLTDNLNLPLPALSFHSLTLDPTNPQVIYAGTGEIAVSSGAGILKSTNGGQSWTLLGADIFQNHVIASIIVDPQNPSRVYAATNLYVPSVSAVTSFPPAPFINAAPGVYVSTDGGQTWTGGENNTPGVSCRDACTGFTDMVASPINPQVMYAAFAGAGLFKTTNGWQSFEQMNFPSRGPSGPYNRLELGVATENGQDVLYVGMESSRLVNVEGQQTTEPWGFVVKSSDGQNWALLDAPNYCGQQCFFDNVVEVDRRTTPHQVYIGGNALPLGDAQDNFLSMPGAAFRSSDGGTTWRFLATSTSAAAAIHADIHAFGFPPGRPNEIWVGHDGGVSRSVDNAQTWQHPNQGLGSLLFVGIGVHPTNPDIVFGGLQDNGKARYDGTRWIGLDTGDGGYSKIDPFDPTIWYSTRFNMPTIMQFQRNINSGSQPVADWEQKSEGIGRDRVGFYAPFTLDPNTPGVIYWGTSRLYRTTNRGDFWQPISPDLTRGDQTQGYISTIAVAPSDSRTVYVGSSDGLLHVTRDVGENWSNVTNAPLPNRFVTGFAIHPTNPQIAYVSFAGFNRNTSETPGHVFKTTNGGQSWQDVSGNLPDVPAHTIVLDPRTPDELYLGTDLGVFYSANGGTTWNPIREGGFTPVPIYELVLNDTTRYLYAATHGRGVWRAKLDDGGTPPPPPTPLPTGMPTTVPPPPVPPQVGFVPGEYVSENMRLSLAADQRTIFNIRVRAPVPGCNFNVVVEQPVQADANGNFSFTVAERGAGGFTVQGQFQRGAPSAGDSSLAQGTSGNTIYLPFVIGGSGGSTPAQAFVTGSTTFRSFNLQNQSCDADLTTVLNWTSPRTGDAAPVPTAAPIPTVQPTATPPPTKQEGINGQVTFNGNPLGNIGMVLIQCPTQGECGDIPQTRVASTRTDAGGFYAFTNVPTLPADSYYQVIYQNGQEGGNATNDLYLFQWFSNRITSYTAGQSLNVPIIDVSDLLPVRPVDNPSLGLPITLEWQKRSIADALQERYGWFLFDEQSGALYCINPADGFTSGTTSILTQNYFEQNCGGQYERGRAWAPVVLDQESGIGFGYYYGRFTASRAGGPTPTSTPDTDVTATPTPTSTPDTDVTATPTPTSTPDTDVTATPTPTSTPMPNDLIVNGSFEQGSVGWQQQSDQQRLLIGVPDTTLGITARTGQNLAALGVADSEIAVVAQTVTIPQNIPTGQVWIFEYFYQLRSDETLCGLGIDAVFIQINGETVTVNGDPLQASLCTSNNTTEWQRGFFGLNNFAGQTITLSFRVTTDSSVTSFAAFDDVSLQLIAQNQLAQLQQSGVLGAGGMADAPASSQLSGTLPSPAIRDASLQSLPQSRPALEAVLEQLTR